MIHPKKTTALLSLIKSVTAFVTGLAFTIVLAGYGMAETITGEVTKVAKGGREIFVESGGGKKVLVNVSGRTLLEGIGDRSEIKLGDVISADVEGGRAIKVKVIK